MDPELFYTEPPRDEDVERAICNNIRFSLDIPQGMRERVTSWYRKKRWVKVFVTAFVRKDGDVQIQATYHAAEGRHTYRASRIVFDEVLRPDECPSTVERRVKTLMKLAAAR